MLFMHLAISLSVFFGLLTSRQSMRCPACQWDLNVNGDAHPHLSEKKKKIIVHTKYEYESFGFAV
jgi:hypothetical protein